MPHTPDDFIFPRGALRPALLGVGSADALRSAVEHYLSAAAGKAAGVDAAKRDDAVSHYVYWRAYEAAAALRASEPVTVSIPSDYAETYGGGSLAWLRAQAKDYEAKFTALLPPEQAAQPVAVHGSSVPTIITW